MMKPLFTTVIAAMTIVSCTTQEESIAQLSDKIFSLAEKQFILLADNLPDDRAPKYLDLKDSLITSDMNWWCSGFFPGSLWLTYEKTGNEEILELAKKNTLKLSNLLDHKTDHDIGFQINNSYGHAYRITKDEKWKPMILAAAERLATRYNPVTKTLKSWDFVPEGRDWNWPVIIDNMMNLELMTNAAKLYHRNDLKEIAIAHANTTLQNHFRKDYSTYHLVDYDSISGNARLHQTFQGFADESAWARGQAWTIYGYTMMARETGIETYLQQAEHIAEYLLERLPEDGIPFWDFDSDKIPEDLRDASAGAIMASAFAELSALTKDKNLALKSREMAEKQVRTLASPAYLAEEGTNGGFLLKHSVGNIPGGTEIDVPLTYADYYFLEAISRLTSLLSH